MVDQTVRFVHPKIQQSCGFVSVQKSEYFAVLPCCSVLSVFQNFRLNIWRVVRVVEGAALEMLCSQKEPRVRIPNSPPRSPVNKQVCRTFLFFSFAQNRLKTMERTGRFLERTRRFRAFWRIRTAKISSFRHHLKFRPTCCRYSPIREVPFR